MTDGEKAAWNDGVVFGMSIMTAVGVIGMLFVYWYG